MIFFYWLAACLLCALACCQRMTSVPRGRWKLERIEVLKNNELKKVIDTGFQYWQFFSSDSIQISNEKSVQRRLKIRAGQDSFVSIDCKTGRIVDEFVIEKLNRQELELSSKKTMERAEYVVVYHLHKMK